MDIKKDTDLKNIPKRKTEAFKNFPMVPRVVFGHDSFSQLENILMPMRRHSDAPMVYLVDAVFEGTELIGKIPRIFCDELIFIAADEEPKTTQVDALVAHIEGRFEALPSGIIGIGGGTLLDLSKAVALLLTNKGKAASYQGWDLIQRKGVYHMGIPTISGTGAEVSRTTVLLGPERKLGINSDHTTFDQVLLDPELTKGVPKEQWFFTGMDCFIHCVESLNGTYLNAFSESYGEKAMELCEEVFLGNLPEKEQRAKLMMASWHGGMSIAYSQVGVAHALSYGLGYVLGTRHGIGNCLVFQHLANYYPEGVALFHRMMAKHDIVLPTGVCEGLAAQQLDTMAKVAMSMEPYGRTLLGRIGK